MAGEGRGGFVGGVGEEGETPGDGGEMGEVWFFHWGGLGSLVWVMLREVILSRRGEDPLVPPDCRFRNVNKYIFPIL